MKDLIGKMVSIGFGLAEITKEQAEKLVDELVKRGEMSRADSAGFVNELMKKAEDARQRMKDSVRDSVRSVVAELKLATKDDIERLERKLDALAGQGKQDG